MTKNGSSRWVPLSDEAIAKLSEAPKDSERPFPVTDVAFRQAWDRLRHRADITDLTFHGLRHEAISRFFEMGLSVPEVAVISGHKDARMLFRYTHLRAENIIVKLG